jgi:hypothetical protein
VDPRTGLDDVEKIFDLIGTRTQTLGRPACNQSLSWLLYLYKYFSKYKCVQESLLFQCVPEKYVFRKTTTVCYL